MPIQSIHVENFKSFSTLDIDLTRFVIIIGSNAAGKSNFISIFKFLRDIARHGLINAISLQGGSEYLMNAKIGPVRDLNIRVVYQPDPRTDVLARGGPGSPQIEVTSCESSYEFSLRFETGKPGFTITRDQLIFGCTISVCGTGSLQEPGQAGGKGEIRVSRVNGKVTYEVTIPDRCPLSKNEIIPIFFRGKKLPETGLLLETVYGYPLPHMEKFFDRIAVYDIDPKIPKKGTATTGRLSLEEDAANLALIVKSIIDDPAKKRKFANLLMDILPFVEDFAVGKFMDTTYILTLKERYAKNLNLPASSLSDGTIIIFALVIALYFEDRPFIVIEEPVSHIHPFLVGRVVAMMKEASEKKQVMITTHSTDVVKHAALKDILLISRDSEGYSVVSRPADKEEVRSFLENEIGIDELYVQNLLGIGS